MYHTCTNCGTRVKIPDEWILIGLNKRIKCESCGKRYNLPIQQLVSGKPSPEVVEKSKKSGTVIMANKGDLVRLTYMLKVADRSTQETITIKEIKAGTVYIIGRSKSDILAFNNEAVPIVIPTKFDGAISRVHFELQFKAVNNKTQIVIKDLNSRNKTFLISDGGREPLNPEDRVFVEVDDKIEIGKNIVITIE